MTNNKNNNNNMNKKKKKLNKLTKINQTRTKKNIQIKFKNGLIWHQTDRIKSK